MDSIASNKSLCIVILLCLFSTLKLIEAQNAQQRWQPFTFQRSNSDTRLNQSIRNNTNLRRTSSFSYRDHCSTNYKFDYIQLTLQWAPGACSTSPQACKRVENKHFTIHGMWPTIKGTQEPANCCFDNTFDYKALEPIKTLLDDYWFSYFDSDSRHFWAHEWLKHGTCSRDIPSLRGEARYFGSTIQLAKQMPILEELKKANIVPNDGSKAYQSSQLISVLTSTISQGKAVSIDCDYEHDQPIPILTGLNFCFDSNMKPADCPDMKRRCKKQVLFKSTSSGGGSYM